MSVRPTKKQKELLSFIENFVAGHGYGPSYREIMQGLGYKSVSTVAVHIDNLIARGHLQKKTASARSLEVVKTSEETDTSVNSNEQWLAGLISNKFEAAELQKPPPPKDIDELRVILKTLKVLGLSSSAQAFNERLAKLDSPKAKVIDSAPQEADN